MRKKSVLLVAFLLVAAVPLTSFASVTSLFKIDGTKNEIKFVNREVVLRYENRAWSPVVNPNNLQNGIRPGDVLVTIFSGTRLTSGPNLLDSGWTPGNADGYLLGYAAQTVKTVSVGAVGPAAIVAVEYDNIGTNPSGLDPFGILPGSAQVAVFDSSSDWVINTWTGNWMTDLQTSVTQTFQNALANVWERFGDVGTDFADTAGTVLGGNNVNLLASYGLSAEGVSGLNFLPADWLGRGVGTDIGGNATVKLNKDFQTLSPWMYDSNDPLIFAAVPEPATLAMWGSFLAIGAVVALRRRRK